MNPDVVRRSRMRKTQEAVMNQECEIEHYIVAEDGTISYRAPVSVKCGVRSTTSASASGNGSLYDSTTADAEMRLPIGTVVGARDRVALVKSFGETLDPVRHYEVCAVPADFGPSAVVVLLKEVYS